MVQAVEIDELILQVFEEHEDLFFWPVTSQKEAKSFVKCIHDKGVAYEDICGHIDEIEHNFSAWRKGLGRVGIGARMIERINKTVESVIESDDEDNMEHNLRQLAKLNKKQQGKTPAAKHKETAHEKSHANADHAKKDDHKPRPKSPVKQEHKPASNHAVKDDHKSHTTHTDAKSRAAEVKKDHKATDSHKDHKPTDAHKTHKMVDSHKEHDKHQTATTHKDHKQQQKDLTSSVMKNVDKHVEKIKEPAIHKKEEHHTKSEPHKSVTTSAHKTDSLANGSAAKSVAKEHEGSKMAGSHHDNEAKNAPVAAKRASVYKEEQKEEPQKKDEEKKASDSHDHSEVDEVKRKMEAIRKKVEAMKKEKAEKQGQHPPSSDHVDSGAPQSPGGAQTSDVTTGSGAPAAEDKYEAMRRKIENLRNKIKSDDDVTTGSEGDSGSRDSRSSSRSDDEQVPPKPSARTSKIETESIPKEEPKKAEDEDSGMIDLKPEPAEQELEESDIENLDSYDSDLDPETYDSDLEYNTNRDVKHLASLIAKEKSRQESRDGPGHVYIYSDSPPDEHNHRIKVGVTRCPDKKFAQAHAFNPSFKQVACCAVSNRRAALKDLNKALAPHKLEQYRDWFSGPIEAILQSVSMVTEKYGSGVALSSFQTSSNC